MCSTLFKDWMAHLCGLCLTLRDEHGHRARLVTNYDGLLVSVLTEAQSATASPRRRAGACALRGFKGADVVTARAEGARLAAAVSLLLAAGKTRDHIADGDGPYARRPVAAAAARMADRWDAAGGATGAGLGFDAAVLRDAVARQAVLERTPDLTLLELLEPTETAVAAAFAHTAVLAGRPGNAEPLAEAGRFFGRLAHLLDAVEDLPADHAAGVFNPLIATDTPLREARRLCDAALHGLRLALADAEFEDRSLVGALLERETRKAVDRTFRGHPYAALDDSAASTRGGLPVLPVVDQYPPGQYPPGVGQRPPGVTGLTPSGDVGRTASGDAGRAPSGDVGQYPPNQYPPGQYPPGQNPPGHYPPPGQLPPGFKPPRRRPGCGPELCLAGAMVGCTCGLWRPEWSEYYGEPCSERCACSRCDGCDGCGNCGECCNCCGGDGGGDGGCCDCNCGCDC